MRRKPLIKVLTERAFTAYMADRRSSEAAKWTEVTIAPDPKSPDPEDYPVYGRYFYRFKQGTLTRLHNEEQVSKRLLDKANQEYLIALKTGLIDGVEI